MAGKDVWYDELMEAADAECPAEPLDAEHPLFILYTSGSTAKPKGILHTTGGYLTHVAYTHKAVFDLKPDEDVYWCSADVGWITGHSYIVYGPLANGATSVMYEGAPDYPDKDIWWELCATLRRDDLLHGADRDPRLHQVGRGVPGAPRPLRAAAARDGRRADQPEGLALVPQGDRRRALPDRRHLVADGDRRDHDHHAAGRARHEAGLRRHGRCRASRPTVVDDDHEDAGTEQGFLTLERPWPGMLRTLYKEEDRFIETYWSKFGKETYAVGDAARRDEDGYFWIIGRIDDVLNVSGHRMSTAEIESAIVSYSRVAEAAVIGQPDEDTGQSVTAFVTLEGARRGRRRAGRRHPRARREADRQARPARSGSSGPTTCPRPARARSCGGCCATSPRGASWATSRRCATRT